MSCVIVGCKSHSSRNEKYDENISFHRFPRDINMRQKWIDAVARSNWQWKKQHRICSKHFSNDCFINTGHKWCRLKSNAVPSQNLRKEIDEDPISINIETVSTFPSTPKLSASEQIHITHRVAQLEKHIEKLKKVAKQRLLKLNSLRQKTKRLKKKNIEVNTRLMDLLKKENIEISWFTGSNHLLQ